MTCHQLSVVATVLNEYANIPAWLSAFERQTVQPMEYIIVDGGSTDGTWELLEGWQPTARKFLIRAERCSISEGRNIGVDNASGDLIAMTDAGTTADRDWIENIVAPLLKSDADVISGFFVPSGDSVWQRTLAAATLPDAEEVVPNSFLPSSRSLAFRKSWFTAGYRYPEWLDYCEDLIFDLQLRKGGARFVFAPLACVTFSPRPTLRSFFVQYFRYARGDGKAGLYYLRHGIRYGSYGALIIVLARKRPHELACMFALGMLSLKKPFSRLVHRRPFHQSVARAIAESPLIVFQRFAGDIAKMAGFPAGVWWRVRRFGLAGFRLSWQNFNADGSSIPK